MSFAPLGPEGGYTLTDEMVAEWIRLYPEEYDEYVEGGLYDPDTHELLDIPEWMNNGDLSDGPFDFELNPSQWTIGW